ncbi:MAG: hypothetical protein QOH84_6013 [Kribbellaceae bacterium]|nr:hypothetical protein [Kribbellaceae bacterium]
MRAASLRTEGTSNDPGIRRTQDRQHPAGWYPQERRSGGVCSHRRLIAVPARVDRGWWPAGVNDLVVSTWCPRTVEGGSANPLAPDLRPKDHRHHRWRARRTLWLPIRNVAKTPLSQRRARGVSDTLYLMSKAQHFFSCATPQWLGLLSAATFRSGRRPRMASRHRGLVCSRCAQTGDTASRQGIAASC